MFRSVTASRIGRSTEYRRREKEWQILYHLWRFTSAKAENKSQEEPIMKRQLKSH